MLAFLGDIMLGNRVAPFLKDGLAPLLEGLQPVTAGRHLVTNLESPLTAVGGVPRSLLSADPTGASLLAEADFAAVSIANNHLFDEGWPGAQQTIGALDSASIPHTGAGANRQEASRPVILNVDGRTVAIVAFSYHTPATAGKPGAAYLYDETVHEALRDAKSRADFVIAMPHAGIELFAYPTPRDQFVYRDMIHSGADLVIGSHPHRVQVMEHVDDKPIYYSLGDAIFYSFTADGLDAFWSGKRHARLFDLDTARDAPRTSLVLTLDFENGAPVIRHHPARIGDTPAPVLIQGEELNTWETAFQELCRSFKEDDDVTRLRHTIQDRLRQELEGRGIPFADPSQGR